MEPLFTVNVASGGTFTCTSPSPKVYVLSFSSPPDNRLTTPFIQAWLLSLDIIEHRHPSGVVITTSSISKFYSNGLDLAHVAETPNFFTASLNPLFRRLLTYPMPTIALLNGHAYAAGCMVAMYHDYRIMNPAKGYLCLNEVHFGAVMAATMVTVFRQKLPNPQTFRTLVLEGKRISATEALDQGVIDGHGDLAATLQFVDDRKLVTLGDAGVYGKLKREMWRESLQLLKDHEKSVAWTDALDVAQDKADEDARERISKWEKAPAKANL